MTAATLQLRTGAIEVEIRPGEGGRIASLVSLATGQQFLTQARRPPADVRQGLDANFLDGACAGIEECLPTVGRSDQRTSGGPAPDHGDFWQLVWDVELRDQRTAVLSATGFSRSLRFEKTVAVEGATLQHSYRIRNVGSEPQSFLYACHPLFLVEAGDRILLPASVERLRLDYSRAGWLGRRGEEVWWPETADGERLDIAKAQQAGTAAMLYTGRLEEGTCSLVRLATGERLELRYDAKKLPYLGVWLCYGGWPEEDSVYRQYAVALEPTTSRYNTLREAQEFDEAVTLAAGEEHSFQISFTVVPGTLPTGRAQADSQA